MTTNSPLPFNRVKTPEGSFLRDDSGNDVGLIYDHADATFICLAANSYHKMREALDWALTYGTFDVAEDNPMHSRALLEAMELLAALKASEGE